ncbi:MAG TPA: hypothetical protein VFV38_31370 [Ktedonobacteraceae bacterium]|nr:hypothetical protein [Ktedonobacteraceae bacterium]
MAQQSEKEISGEATYGDTVADSASAYYGRNELREELRKKVEEL